MGLQAVLLLSACGIFNHHGAKEAVFPFDKLQKLPRLGNARASTAAALGLRSFPEGDPVIDSEMRSL